MSCVLSLICVIIAFPATSAWDTSSSPEVDFDQHVGETVDDVHVLLLQTQHVTGRKVRHQRIAAEPQEAYWSRRGANAATSGVVNFTAPSTFSAGPAWIWANDLGEQVRHSPLIDLDKSVYVMTTTRLRKFSSEGELLWTWLAGSDRVMVTCPTLHQGHIYVLPLANSLTRIATLTAIDMATGLDAWNKTFENAAVPSDSQSLLVSDGIIFFGAGDPGSALGGTTMVVAADASNGDHLWEYNTGDLLWNFSPSTPGDGTLLFSGSCGGVWRLNFTGELIWRAGTEEKPGVMCVPGGGVLGPNGIFYAEFQSAPGMDADGQGQLAAYNVTDGAEVWRRDDLPLPTGQYPAVGRLGADGPLAVVAPIGNGPGVPTLFHVGPHSVTLRNAVVALDAATGATLWLSEERPWDSSVAAGEIDVHNPADGSICLPDTQGIPVIASDGTIYASSSHHGDLRAIRNVDNNGVIEQSEVSAFRTGKCFLNSPSLAPDMLVVAPCWGPVYVFKGP